jgi:heat shock protein HslJ
MNKHKHIHFLAVLLITVTGAFLLIACEGTTETTSSGQLTGIIWQWQRITIDGEGETMVTTPEVFTAIFNEDGSMGGSNDCNVYGGDFTRDGSTIDINPGMSTMAFCGEESLDMLFTESLMAVTAWSVEGSGNLVLEGGGRRMVFANAVAP